MGKMKNFWLMLKQGIKGVFQFKAQFIIIIILAFVATFILSISVSTQRRVQGSFNKIVKPVDKFKYSGNIQLHSSLDGNDDPFLLSTEVDNWAPTDYVINSDGITSEKSSFNFVFNNRKNGAYKDANGNAYESFLTRGTEKFMSEVNGSDSFSDTVVTLNRDYLKEMFFELNEISKLAKENKPLNSFSSQTKYSPAAIYTYGHSDWLKPFIKNSDSVKKVDDVQLVYDNSNSTPNKDIFNNIVTGVSQLSTFLNNVWHLYESSSSKAYTDSTNTAVALLFGENLKSDSTNYGIWTSDPNYTLNLKLDTNKDNKGKNQVIAKYKDLANVSSSADAIWNSGLRGITNPFIDGNKVDMDADGYTPTLVNNWNYFKYLNMNPYTDPINGSRHRIINLYRQMEVDNNWYDTSLGANDVDDLVKMSNSYAVLPNSSWSDKSATYFRAHEKLTAEAAGFKYGIRRESTYFDANNQLKFRGIALTDEEKYNFTILRGNYPAGGNDIAISEQFARKNHYKVGDSLKSGDAVFLITAIATDAFSYLPQQDLNNPIPNPSVSSFVYAAQGTLDQMWNGSRTGVGSDDAVTQNYSYFMFDDKNGFIKDDSSLKEKAFFALHSNDQGGALVNSNAAKELVNTGNITGWVSSHIKLDSFDKSAYRYSWTLQPLVFKAYDTITFIAAAVIAVIALISIGVCVKKTIDLNSKQIGILKALGEKPLSISFNYLSYSIIVGLIVVPVAWIIGNLLQIPFGNMFFTYFSIQPQVILWDWISFVIAFGVLGLLSTVIAFATAWALTGKPVLSILVSSIKWGRLRFIDFLKNHVFKKAPFSTRFSLTLTSSGSRQIVLMTVVMFVASLLMSAALAIPSVVTRVNSTYYKSVKYANKYDDVSMIGNAPLSKGSISDWNGQDWLDKDYVAANLPLDNSDAKYGYYKDPEAYTSSISDSNTLPQYLYDTTDSDNPKIADTYRYIMQHQQELLAIVGTMFGNNYFTHLGVSFSVGMVDKFYGVLLHSLENITNLQNTGKAYTDEDKLNDAQFLSGWLTSSIPKIIEAIVNSNASSSGDNGATDTGVKVQTWKQKVMDVIYKVVPSYVKAYIQKSDSRLDQYAIAYNNEFYIPGQETLTTTVDGTAGKSSLTLTGLDQYQHSLVLDKDSIKKAYLSQKTKDELYERLNPSVNDSDIINKDVVDPETGFKLYDGSTHTLTIPVVANKQGASAYKLSTGDSLNGWSNPLTTMQFKTKDNGFFDLPSTAWVYDDSDFANYLKSNPDTNYLVKNGAKLDKTVPYASDKSYTDGNNNWIYEATDDGSYYINPTMVNNNKLTFTKEFSTDSKSIVNRAQMFKEFMYDKDGNPTGTYLRPYYQYKDMRLMFPEEWIDKQNMLWPGGSWYTEDHKGNTKSWYSEKDASAIPESVKDGYSKLADSTEGTLKKDALDGKWLVINPYDLNYYQDGFQDHQKMALTNLVDGPGYWYRYSLAGNNQIQVATTTNIAKSFYEDGAAKDLKINLKSVGEIDSYNDKLVVADSDLANLLMKYPTYRYYEYNYQVFDKSKHVAPGEKDKVTNTNTISAYDRWAPKETSGEQFVYNDWSKNPNSKLDDVWTLSDDSFEKEIGGNQNILNYAPHAFYNGKLSNIEEPLEYSSQISFTKATRIGQQAIALGDATSGGTISIVKSSTLLSTTKNLIKQVAVLAIAIGAMLVVAIIITAALVTMLTGDIYIAQYKRFMVLLRALGYSKAQVFTYTFGTVTILALIAWVAGTILAWGLIYVGVHALWASGFAIPMGITWWPIVVSFAIMFISYFGSLWVSSGKARKANPSEVLTATAE